MSDELKELISSADKGSTAAQRELMQRGDAASAAGDHQQAAYLYKMAAMAYRIDAGRNGALAGECSTKLQSNEQLLSTYHAWIEESIPLRSPKIINLMKYDRADIQAALTQIISSKAHSWVNDSLESIDFDFECMIINHGSGNSIDLIFNILKEIDDYWEALGNVYYRVEMDRITDVILKYIHDNRSQGTAEKLHKQTGGTP